MGTNVKDSEYSADECRAAVKYNDSMEELLDAAWSPHCPLDVMEILLRENNFHIDFVLINNPNLPHKIMAALCKRDRIGVRYKAITREDCPVFLIRKLVNDSAYQIREAAMKHPNCPMDAKIAYLLAE